MKFLRIELENIYKIAFYKIIARFYKLLMSWNYVFGVYVDKLESKSCNSLTFNEIRSDLFWKAKTITTTTNSLNSSNV